MGSLIATGIASPHLGHVWADLWPMLEPAYAWSPQKANILAGLRTRDFQLWAVYEDGRAIAAVVTRLYRDVGTGAGDCRIWLVGGKKAAAWLPDFLPKLIGWARVEGCTRLSAAGRKGWWPLVRRYGGVRTADEDGMAAWALEISDEAAYSPR